MEKKLCKNTISTLRELPRKDENEQPVASNGNPIGKEVKQRYVALLLTLLRSVYIQHLPPAWNWKDVRNVLVTYKTRVSLAKDTKVAYNKLAAQIGIPLNM